MTTVQRPRNLHSKYRAHVYFDAHRDGLTILVHADTGRRLEDHTTHAYWLGQPAELNLAMFQQGGGG